jgi:hypothetical protein
MARSTRRFGMGDLMLLIVALAVGMWGARSLARELTAGPASFFPQFTPSRLIVASLLSSFATPLTLAFLAIRLRRPRPLWKRVSLQPGTAALIACTLIFVVRTFEVGAALAAPHVAPSLNFPSLPLASNSQTVYQIRASNATYLTFSKVRDSDDVNLMSWLKVYCSGCYALGVASYSYPCGYAVAGVWMVLAISGRWRPEKSWIDRGGRVLGLTWISITIMTALPV